MKMRIEMGSRAEPVQDAIRLIYARARVACHLVDVASLPRDEFAYPGTLRDALIEAVLDGSKTTTTSLLEEYRRAHESIRPVDTLSVPIDSGGRPVCVLRQMAVRICRIDEVGAAHARHEGEGFRDVASWRRAHEGFWSSDEFLDGIGTRDLRITDSTEVVCERFVLVQRLR